MPAAQRHRFCCHRWRRGANHGPGEGAPPPGGHGERPLAQPLTSGAGLCVGSCGRPAPAVAPEAEVSTAGRRVFDAAGWRHLSTVLWSALCHSRLPWASQPSLCA